MTDSTPTIYGLCVPDEHYIRIMTLLDESKDQSIYLKDKSAITHHFFKDGDDIYADKEETDGNILKYKVMKLSEANTFAEKNKQHSMIKNRVKSDFPDMSEDEVQAHADVLNEANESVKRLINSGMPKELAVKLISLVIEGGEKQFSTPEDIVKLINEVSTPVEGVSAADVPDEGNVVADAVRNIIVNTTVG